MQTIAIDPCAYGSLRNATLSRIGIFASRIPLRLEPVGWDRTALPDYRCYRLEVVPTTTEQLGKVRKQGIERVCPVLGVSVVDMVSLALSVTCGVTV